MKNLQIDEKLIALWGLKINNFKLQELSKHFQLSEKQIKRILKKWEEQGFITYKPGSGRGNESSIKWLIDLENILINQMKQSFSLRDFRLLHLLPSSGFSNLFYSQVSNLVTSNLYGSKSVSEEILTFPIFSSKLELHPHRFNDAESGFLIGHVFSRLIKFDENNQFTGDLVHHWLVSGPNVFQFYLRKSLKWHDGTTVELDQIVKCLLIGFNLEKLKKFKSNLISISKLNNSIIEIQYLGEEEELLYVLARIEMSIFRDSEAGLMGCGPYTIEQLNISDMMLQANDSYHLERAIIDNVHLVQIPSHLNRKSLLNGKEMDYQVVSEYAGIFSAYIGTTKLLKTNKALMQLIREAFSYFSRTISEIDHLKISTHFTIISKNTNTDLVFPEPITIKYCVNKKVFVDYLVEVMHLFKVNVHVVHVPVTEAITFDDLFNETDIVIKGDIDYPLPGYEKFSNKCEDSNVNFEVLELYHSYREVLYPKLLKVSKTKIFGYPLLSECWVSI
ncbi:ABC transporter substrate-binding protein [Cytobacillus praedii]|uniref:ABC transporter substrate-binding protein n=1 Tax=Cytobacillus praedii TaxID=1742358 RepID=UPI003AF464FE